MLTGANDPSAVGREAILATSVSPEFKRPPSSFSSERKTVSPSGVKTTSPKISSKFKAAAPVDLLERLGLMEADLDVKKGGGTLGSVMVNQDTKGFGWDRFATTESWGGGVRRTRKEVGRLPQRELMPLKILILCQSERAAVFWIFGVKLSQPK